MKKNVHDKFNQNSIVNKKVIVYNKKDEKIGEAGVIRESDFDFDALVNMAMKTSGSKIEVA